MHTLASLGVEVIHCAANDSRFDELVKRIQPTIAVFDRFMMEEQFGWRLRAHCPRAMRVLDSIDLHCLRRIRERRVVHFQNCATLDTGRLGEADFQCEDVWRELASIFRCDVTLLTSEVELELLKSLNVPAELLQLLPIFYEIPNVVPAFKERNNFVFIGNFNHAPNFDACRVLRGGLWEQIRGACLRKGEPDVELHIYGSYPGKRATEIHSPPQKIIVKGWAEDAVSTLSQYRVNLAPLRFGAGLKGKILDGWVAGTPCIASNVAAEGLKLSSSFGGLISDVHEQFADSAAVLLSDNQVWKRAQETGLEILSEKFGYAQNSQTFFELLARVTSELEDRRDRNLMGAMLSYHMNRSSEYFSRWIEEKNRVTLKD